MTEEFWRERNVFLRKVLSKEYLKPYTVLRLAAQLFAYGYSAAIAGYFVLRLLFWDRFWLVGFVSSFIPLILLPIFILPWVWFFILKNRGLAIASSIVCLWLLSWLHINYWSPTPSRLSNPELTLKILSLNNSWHKTTPDTLVKLILKQEPDLVCLQELTTPHVRKGLPQLKSTYPYQVVNPTVAILSKYPIHFSEYLHLANHQRDFQQRAILRVNQKDIVVYNIQTTSPWIRYPKILPFLKFPIYEYGDRTEEIRDFVERLEKETLPVIAAGDFNMTDQSQDYDRVKKVLQDSFWKTGFGFGFTWPHGWELSFLIKNSNWKLNYPIFRIDYIWYSKPWRSKFTQVLPTTGSDHLPVEAELILAQRQPKP